MCSLRSLSETHSLNYSTSEGHRPRPHGVLQDQVSSRGPLSPMFLVVLHVQGGEIRMTAPIPGNN